MELCKNANMEGFRRDSHISYCKQINVLLSFYMAPKFPHIYCIPTEPFIHSCCFIREYNLIGICDDHNVCNGASCFKEH